jgi:hypothetical protein
MLTDIRQRSQTINTLLAEGVPPIPVAPLQDPRQKRCHRISKSKDGWDCCPLDKNFQPVPLFTGKNPSYLAPDGSPRPLNHRQFQKRLPTAAELKKFFCHPDTGIGTLGGHGGIVWLDFDAKNYDSQEACDNDVERIITSNHLGGTWIERTGSGGWRIAVKPRQKPTFTNFATRPDGPHIGEALFEGRFTVLAPSIHPNGNPYRRTGWGMPLEVESLELCSIYPSKDELEQLKRKQKRQHRAAVNPHCSKPTSPTDNPRDIRNFAHYFEGYHERPDGWAAAKCPHHNGTSLTSFRVRLATGEYKLWCGCDTKDVYKSGLRLAVSSGYKLPEHQNTISRDEWELKFGLVSRLRERIQQTLQGVTRFVIAPSHTPTVKEAPDQLFQEANQRLTTWQDAVATGYKFILDKSAPSLGKSHAAGIALPDAFAVDSLWYISTDHRNPTTGVIEQNYTDLPVRHNGLKIDESRKTPQGNPFLVWPKAGEEPDTKGNCFRADLFQKFRAKNLNVAVSKSSPICLPCKLAHLCKQGSGGKYGATFRGERQNALASDRIRAHADSLPSPEDFDYSRAGMIWDEVGVQLKPMDSVDVTLTDFDQVWAELEAKSEDLHEALKPLRLALRPLLTGELKQPYHGWDDASIRVILPQKPDNLSQIINELEVLLQPDLSFLSNQPDFIAAEKGISRATRNLINQTFRRQAHEEFSEAFQRLALNWLVPFLYVWAGSRGAFRCSGQTLTIFSRCERHAAVARAASFNLFLDATITRERLALLLGIDPSEIYVVEQETPLHGNLRIIQVTGMGKLGKDRSQSKQRQVAALRKELEERYPGIVFGDWKTHACSGDGYWFVNLRGSNEFRNASAMCVFGIPYQNVGHLQALYQTLTGDSAPLDKETPHEGLQRFIEAHVQAEIEQAVGRLRAHIRPNKQLTFFFVGDYDLSFLGLPIEQVEAFVISQSAGTPAQITRWKILEAVRQLQNQREKVTQIAVATVANISQPLIAKIAARFGGWKRLKKLLLALLDPLYSASNNSHQLTSEETWLARTYLPCLLDEPEEVAAQEIGQVIRVYGISAFLQIVAVATPQTQANLLALVMKAMPTGFQSELLALLDGGG